MHAKFRDFVVDYWDRYRALRYLFMVDSNYREDVNRRARLWCVQRGFASNKVHLYGFPKTDYRDYVSDFQQYLASKINRPYSILLSDKSVFAKIHGLTELSPRVYGRISCGKIFFQGTEISLDSFVGFLQEHKRVIVKKSNGSRGIGVFRVEYREGSGVLINNEAMCLNEFEGAISSFDDYLICEHLDQADYAKAIFPGTVNTIRILTMREPKTNQIFVASAVHRFGTSKTQPVDNVWRGGISSNVDLETGILKKAALHKDEGRKIEWLSHHPDTKMPIEGTSIPNWSSVLEAIISAVEPFHFFRYVGWDVVVQNEAIRVIEGNNSPALDLHQVHSPLLRDERIRDFFSYHGVV